MAVSAGVGTSTHTNAQVAGREAAAAASSALAQQTPTATPKLALVFATTGHNQVELIAGVREVCTHAALAGCSGEGIITHLGSEEASHRVAVAVLAGEGVEIEVFSATNLHAAPQACAAALADRISQRARSHNSLVMIFPDGLCPSVPTLLGELEARLPPHLPIVGGTAADMLQFRKTYQYANDQVLEDAVVAVLISGAFTFDIEVSHGCTPIGLERVVTQSIGHVVQAIDGKPAWHVLREYLADRDGHELDAFGAVHLSVARKLGDGDMVIRSPLQLLPDGEGLFFAGGIEEGAVIQLTRRDPDAIRDAAELAARAIEARAGGKKPSLVLQFDCAGRGRIIFGNRTNDVIVRPLQDILGQQTPWIGFHTFGEIAPIAAHTRFHNYSVVLCALYNA